MILQKVAKLCVLTAAFAVATVSSQTNSVAQDNGGNKLLNMVVDIVHSECTNNNICVPYDVMQGIVLKESGLDPTALRLEKKLVKVKFKSIEGEDEISKLMSPYSFGLMQINWGYHKQTCEGIIRDNPPTSSGVPISYALFNPAVNIRCAVRILHEKMVVAGRVIKNTEKKIHEAVRLYNGANAPVGYADDVMKYTLDIKLGKFG